MNQPEQEELARKLVQHLDHGVDRLAPEVRQGLQKARNLALSKYHQRPEPVLGLAGAGQAAAWMTTHRFYDTRSLITVAALVLALVGVAYWQGSNPVAEIADIDTSLLTDELPVNAYLDKGFDSWLKRSSR